MGLSVGKGVSATRGTTRFLQVTRGRIQKHVQQERGPWRGVRVENKQVVLSKVYSGEGPS